MNGSKRQPTLLEFRSILIESAVLSASGKSNKEDEVEGKGRRERSFLCPSPVRQ